MIYRKFAENLFHFKADQADYSIKQANYGTKLLSVDKGDRKSMLNEFFFHVFSKVLSWQSMSELTVTTLDNVTELILNSSYQALPSMKSGP